MIKPYSFKHSLDSKYCIECNSLMKVKYGKYGFFWSCIKYPNCNYTESIKKLPDPNVASLDFFDINSSFSYKVINELKSTLENEDVPSFVQSLIKLQNNDLTKGWVNNINVRGKISGLFEYLSKHNKNFLAVQIAYLIYKLENCELPERLDYFLNKIYNDNTLEGKVKHKEYQIKNAIIKNWKKTPFYKLYELELVGHEIPIGNHSGEDGGYILDVIAKNKFGNYSIIEIKGPSKKGKSAWWQADLYRRKCKFLSNQISSYIVAKGFPRGIDDESIGLIGYTFEENNLALIPWREAKFIKI